jgi:N-acetylglucosaminyldiphosphoundecaprenol N-acetyl-beta-D-mannosaminyltransferase
MKQIKISGIPLSLCSQEELLIYIHEMIATKQRALILSGNVHSFNLAYSHPWLRSFFEQADIVRLDGAGLRLGARILGHTTPARMTWADFAWALADFAAQHHLSLFLLGARPGVVDKAAARLRAFSPQLLVAGTHHGYFDKNPESAENKSVLQVISAARPDILIVGFGMPLQERWLMENWEHIEARAVLTGGAVFDYVAGELQRAPSWMTNHGLEWLGRLMIEPRRLWQRYLIGNPLFMWRVFKQRLGILRLD